jgi:hypothetical protein
MRMPYWAAYRTFLFGVHTAFSTVTVLEIAKTYLGPPGRLIPCVSAACRKLLAAPSQISASVSVCVCPERFFRPSPRPAAHNPNPATRPRAPPSFFGLHNEGREGRPATPARSEILGTLFPKKRASNSGELSAGGFLSAEPSPAQRRVPHCSSRTAFCHNVLCVVGFVRLNMRRLP